MIRGLRKDRYLTALFSTSKGCHIAVKSAAGGIRKAPYKISLSNAFTRQTVVTLPEEAQALADKLLQLWGGSDKTEEGNKPIVLKVVRGNESDFQF